MRKNFLEIKKGYKIVNIKNGIYTSFFNNEYFPGTIDYKINEWVYPILGNGPLAIFNTLSAAKDFAYCYDNYKIFSCLFIPNYYQDRLWFINGNNKGALRLGSLPIGTVLASQIKLIEEIECIL